MYEDRPRFELGYFYENLEDVKGDSEVLNRTAIDTRAKLPRKTG
jgi:hypothetical protein